jgi:serine/threonine-protein kinase
MSTGDDHPKVGGAPALGLPDAVVGKTLGGSYRVVRRLDQGGMGVVFMAEHVRLGRAVAVKFLAGHLATDGHALSRFRREAEIVGRLQHPHVVEILDFDWTDEGQPFIVMELLHGESLAARLDREHVLAVPEAVRIAAQIASGLAAAHEAGIVHRDLKPANVFLVTVAGEPPFVKLLDFGISRSIRDSSRVTLDRELVGTPSYMAPEQALGEGDDIDHRADEFALAAVVYEMLTGRLAFAASSLAATVRRVLEDEPDPVSRHAPWAPAAIDVVLARAFAKNPHARFTDATAFAAALAEAAAGAPAVLPPTRERSRVEVATVRVSRGDGQGRPVVDRTAAIADAVARAHDSLAQGQVDDAIDAAEVAIAEAGRGGSAGVEMLKAAVPLFERIFRRRIGRTDVALAAIPASLAANLSSQEAFIISRLTPPASASDLMDAAVVPRPQALRLLARLLRRGLVAPVAPHS